MSRRNRYRGAGITQHIYDRGNNKQIIFVDDIDRAAFMSSLFTRAADYDIALHAWVLMSNHFHILATPKHPGSISKFMQAVKSSYTQYFNSRHSRTGTLWEARFKQALSQDDNHILILYRYIELNPVRASMVRGPRQYHWSSYHTNARLVPSENITPHPYYLLLGIDEFTRAQAYRNYVAGSFDKDKSQYEAEVAVLKTTAANLAVFGSEEFYKKLSAEIDYPITHFQRLTILAERYAAEEDEL